MILRMKAMEPWEDLRRIWQGLACKVVQRRRNTSSTDFIDCQRSRIDAGVCIGGAEERGLQALFAGYRRWRRRVGFLLGDGTWWADGDMLVWDGCDAL